MEHFRIGFLLGNRYKDMSSGTIDATISEVTNLLYSSSSYDNYILVISYSSSSYTESLPIKSELKKFIRQFFVLSQQFYFFFFLLSNFFYLSFSSISDYCKLDSSNSLSKMDNSKFSIIICPIRSRKMKNIVLLYAPAVR